MEEQENAVIDLNDAIATEMVEKQIASFEQQRDLFIKAIENHKLNKENYEKQWALEDEIYQIQLEGDNLSKITPDYKFETNSRFWELRKAMQGYVYREQKFMAEKKLAEYDRLILEAEQSLMGILEKMSDMKGE